MPRLPDAVMRFQRSLPKTLVIPFLLRHLGVILPLEIEVKVRVRAPKEDDVLPLDRSRGGSHGKSPNGKPH